MQVRGDIYWSRSDPTLHHRTDEKTLSDCSYLEVRVRLSRTGATQMFIGVYAPSGKSVYEEAFDSRPNESMTRAMAWGVTKARHVIGEESVDREAKRLL
ncbi:hypothetical protein PSH58_09485 [Pseudomonas hefeiensis]|uniref:Uncharacterized protein n=1 Tax=Pseudomonas hefeiensis TaxID=2738125 RepID=A0ABY9GGE7_9PSED|nr:MULTISPECIES: hypothetical protein [unclassified Pseudomonas]WLH14515.1 hypothetical protein PSH57_09480 [Pseudomonas sp. FP205]WLH97577.1 hypothetical protein PSH58_09485 [Pseudomonas sp. FP53]WLI41848.1 hypothetical protein PSH74_09470 [Pseudomonas sp. FP821]